MRRICLLMLLLLLVWCLSPFMILHYVYLTHYDADGGRFYLILCRTNDAAADSATNFIDYYYVDKQQIHRCTATAVLCTQSSG